MEYDRAYIVHFLSYNGRIALHYECGDHKICNSAKCRKYNCKQNAA